MSHFIFGTFNSHAFSEQNCQIVKGVLETMKIKVLFNQELSFCSDVNNMMDENGDQNCYRFFISSLNQEYNSDDVLFPYDQYSESELFPNGNDRTTFNQICESHIRNFKGVLEKLILMLQINKIKIFVVDGYDNRFTTSSCSLDNMLDDILAQVKSTFSLSSVIYEIQLPEQHLQNG